MCIADKTMTERRRKMNKKAIIAIFLIALLSLSLLAACGKASESQGTGQEEGKLQIMTTIFPEYDCVINIVGDNSENVEVSMLLDNGVDLHSYQPTAEDIMKISTCDLFIYVGGESDEWVADALKESTNPDMIVINLLEVLGDEAKIEEVIEGMEGHDHEEGHEDDHEGEDHEGEAHDHEDNDHEDEYDEHVWLSLKNAEVLVREVSLALQTVDSINADTYKKNAEEYISALQSLDDEYRRTISNATNKTLLFGDRFPFRYLVDDYGLTYYAAFAGCSAETEASFETISFLSKKVDELSLGYVVAIEGSDGKLADTIINNTEKKNQTLLKLDSMQAITKDDVENGASYLDIMKKNLDVLKEALN